MTDATDLITCPVCGDEYLVGGPLGIVPHILAEHKGTRYRDLLAEVVLDVVLDQVVNP